MDATRRGGRAVTARATGLQRRAIRARTKGMPARRDVQCFINGVRVRVADMELLVGGGVMRAVSDFSAGGSFVTAVDEMDMQRKVGDLFKVRKAAP